MNNHAWKNCFPDMDEWDIYYVNMLIGEERKCITMPEGKSFMGLYLNLGVGHKYTIEGHLPDTIHSGRYNFIFVPEGAAQLTLEKGTYAALCIEFSTAIVFRLAEEYPMLKKLLKGENLKIPVILSYINMVITSEMNDSIQDIQKDHQDYLKEEIVKHSRVINLLACSLNNIKAMATARLKKSDVDKVVTVHDYLIHHLNSILSVDQLADMVGVYRSKLEKTFKVVYRKSVIQFFLDEKLKQAAILLRDTKLPVKQIAGKVGFKSVPRFSEAFKKHYSCSPTEFRKLSVQ